jgi:hypothetical protein
MERRSFFSSVAGLFLGAKAVVPGPKDPPSPPAPDPQVPVLGSERPLLEATHTDFVAMLADIRNWVSAHPGATVLSADYPSYRHIGYVAFVMDGDQEISSSFTIHVRDIRQSFRGKSGIVGSSHGRQLLAAQLMKG